MFANEQNMGPAAEPAPGSQEQGLDEGWRLVQARLRKLREERRLVERAIAALRELGRMRQARTRQKNRMLISRKKR